MSTIPSADSILIRQKRTLPGQESEPAETSLSLAAKLKELFDEGYGQDDLFGLVIPLLMQGKIRINRETWMERLELEDKNMRLQRSPAIQIFDQYLNQRAAKKPSPLPKPANPIPKAAAPAPVAQANKPQQAQPPLPSASPKPDAPPVAIPPQPVIIPKTVALPQPAAASVNPPKSPAPAPPKPPQDIPPSPVLKPRPTLIRRP